MPGLFKTKTQTGFVFAAVATIGGTGILLLILQAFAQSSWSAGLRFVYIGGMTAIAGLGLGGLVGLIFGLPESTPIVVANAPPKDDGASAAAQPASGDWYRDSSSLERIATWLTGAIIALSLANFESWTARFDRTAMSIGLAMQGSTAEDLASGSNRAAEAQAALKAIARAKEETTAAFKKRKVAAAEKAADTAAQASRDRSAAEVLGGLLLGGYAFLGFAASYLWTRRYLPAELAKARRDMRQETRLDAKDSAELDAARANHLTQEASKMTTDPRAAAAAVAAATAEGVADDGREAAGTHPIIQPGPIQNDPWKGQFGGSPTTENAEVSATVREVTGRSGLFLISLVICGRNANGRAALAGTQARLYLHPTFPEPIIRTIDFDRGGVAEVKMSAVGAFTVGVQIMSSGELLELDLSGLRDAPAAFRLN